MTAIPRPSLHPEGARAADPLASVDYILCFDALLDAIQARELKRCSSRWREGIMRVDGRPCSVVHGAMPYGRLLRLHFCRRNSTCSLSVAGLGIHEQVVWTTAGEAPA